MSRAERSKGARGENEVVDLIRAAGWPRATRNWRSGGSGNGDIVHGPAGVHWECKRTERLRLRDAWRQASTEAKPGDIPIVAIRWSAARFEPAPAWLAVLELEDVLEFLHFRETAL